MRMVPMVLMLALAMAGGAASAAPAPPTSAAASTANASTPNLDGTEWRFVDVAGQPLPAGVVATLRLRHGRASGKTGCNAYAAPLEMSAAGGVAFGAVMSTKMACLTPAGAMRVERGVFAALRHAAKFERNGGNLILLDASGRRLATLQPQSSP